MVSAPGRRRRVAGRGTWASTGWLAVVAAALLATACAGPDEGAGPAGPTRATGAPADLSAPFEDVTATSGLDFTHRNGMSGELYLCEIMGPGGALFDYDGDGDLDLYVVQGHMLGEGETSADALVPPPGPLGHRLFRNDTPGGDAPLRFTDVTQASGIDERGYGMGAAAGDYDGDGDVDLYVTNLGSNRLYRNEGDGTFRDVTAAAGADDPRWSVSAAFVDHDLDGDLDLYVGNYLDFTVERHKDCFYTRRDYCSPQSYRPVPDRLFENRGDGTFRDATADSGIASAYGPALGVVVGDFDLDGRPDLYVANDGMANQCWRNLGGGRFEDVALLGGSALSAEGLAEASMGVDAGDFDNDGDEDLFMAHLAAETNTLYVNDGRGQFEDRTIALGLAAPSKPYTGFGTGWFDYDNDGWLDVLVVNGAVRINEGQRLAGEPLPLREPALLFRNLTGTGFAVVAGPGDPVFGVEHVGRGALFGDLDNDGDTDAVVLNNGGPLRLLRNRIGNAHHWLGVSVVERPGAAPALGAWVELRAGDGPSLWRRVRAAASYAGSNDPRPLFGLGTRTGPVTVRVHWPGGAVEQWRFDEIDRWVEVVRGSAGG